MTVPIPRLLGMVHSGPLPGSPRFDGDLDRVVELARRDAIILVEAGFPALIVENYGDAPFFASDVPLVTVAAMTRVVVAVAGLGVPVGVNVLRNDAMAAMAIAAATGASFVRINVLAGSMFTDQGLIEGRAAEVLRSRRALNSNVKLLADVFVKHALPPPGLTIEQAALDTWVRGGADVLVVSGSATGQPADRRAVQAVRTAVPDAPLLLGSGVSATNLGAWSDLVDGAIIGTSIKMGSLTTNPVDPAEAQKVVVAAAVAGWL